MAIIPASNAAELTAALNAAVPGDRIELALADYGAFFTAHTFAAPGVTIISADTANQATFTKIDASGSIGLAFEWLKIGPSASQAIGATDIAFRHCTFQGDLDATNKGLRQALFIKQCVRPKLESSEFFHWRFILKVAGCDDAEVVANNMHDFDEDAMKMNSNFGLLLQGNWIHDRLAAGSGHGDGMQVSASNPLRPATDYIVRGNFFDAGATKSFQTMFWRNQLAEQSPGDFSLYYKNNLIEDNVIWNGHSHGISIGESDGITIRNNTLLHAPGLNNAPTIQKPNAATAASLNKVVTGNILEKFNSDPVNNASV